MNGTRVGGVALGSAALGDVVAWLMLAAAIIVAGGGKNTQWRGAVDRAAGVASFLVLRPLLNRLALRQAGRDSSGGAFAAVLAGLLVWSALKQPRVAVPLTEV